MTKLEAVKKLSAAVESGSLANVSAADIYHAFGRHLQKRFWEAWHGSLDAAKALHDAVLPGWVVNGLDQAANLAGNPWGCEVAYFDGPNPNNNRKAYSWHDFNNPARAWLIAILKALIAQEEAE